MANTVILSAQVDPYYKERAEELFGTYGLSTNMVINSFLSECARTGEIPLDFVKHIRYQLVSREELDAITAAAQQVDEEDAILLDPENMVIYALEEEMFGEPDAPAAERSVDFRD